MYAPQNEKCYPHLSVFMNLKFYDEDSVLYDFVYFEAVWWLLIKIKSEMMLMKSSIAQDEMLWKIILWKKATCSIALLNFSAFSKWTIELHFDYHFQRNKIALHFLRSLWLSQRISYLPAYIVHRYLLALLFYWCKVCGFW